MSDLEDPLPAMAHLASGTLADKDAPQSAAMAEENPAGPRQWAGPRSGVTFYSHLDGDHAVLGIRLETEIPIVVREAMRDLGVAEEFADLFDLGFQVARDGTEAGIEVIRSNGLGLTHARDYIQHTYESARESLDKARGKMEVTPANAASFASNERSIETLKRIAERLDGAIGQVFPPARVALFNSDGPSAASH